MMSIFKPSYLLDQNGHQAKGRGACDRRARQVPVSNSS